MKLFRQFNLLIWTSIVGQFVHPLGGVGIRYRGWMWGIVILATFEYYFSKVHENLVKHPCKNILIIKVLLKLVQSGSYAVQLLLLIKLILNPLNKKTYILKSKGLKIEEFTY